MKNTTTVYPNLKPQTKWDYRKPYERKISCQHTEMIAFVWEKDLHYNFWPAYIHILWLLVFVPRTGVQQVIQFVPIPKEVISAPDRADSLATHDLVFQAANLPPLGFRSYYVTKVSSSFTEVKPSDETFIGDAVSTVLLMMWASMWKQSRTDLLWWGSSKASHWRQRIGQYLTEVATIV